MMTALQLISIFGNIGLTALGASGVISPNTTKLTTDLLTGTLPLVQNIVQNPSQAKSQDVLALLAALSAVITTLQKDTALPADKLALIQSYESDVQAAIVGYVQAGKGLDLTQYTPIAPV
ncbi:MAG: hypothetical protein KGL39_30500 [Patescibacteria group bacterium]|nr:hypothetical protein [Patescibacteria group bacterium]